MKKLINVVLVTVLAISFISCTKEQSSFEVSDIKTKANIRGVVMQNLGQDYKSGKYIENIVPVADKKIYVEVRNSEYASGSQNGVTVFETITDVNGQYSIDVPVLYEGTQVTVKGEQFVGIYKEVVGATTAKPEYDAKEGVYTFTDKTMTLYPNDIKFYDALYTMDYRESIETSKYYSTFIVRVGVPQYSVEWDYEYGEYVEYINLEYALASNVNVVAKIGGSCYAATTNNSGEATFVIPAMEKEWSSNVSIETTPYVVNGFKYATKEYIDYEYQYNTYTIESGIMSYYKQDVNNITFSGISGDKAPIVKVALGFDAHSDVETYG